MRHIFWILTFFITSHVAIHAQDDASHLRGIHFLYMNIDTSFATEVTAMERLDLSEIMELQLRRGDIDLRAYIANKPDLNVPLVELSIDTASRAASGQFDLILRVRDHVTIDRNKEKTVATIFEMRRAARSDVNEINAMKAELRELMADFVAIYRQQNPGA